MSDSLREYLKYKTLTLVLFTSKWLYTRSVDILEAKKFRALRFAFKGEGISFFEDIFIEDIWGASKFYPSFSYKPTQCLFICPSSEKSMVIE